MSHIAALLATSLLLTTLPIPSNNATPQIAPSTPLTHSISFLDMNEK
ncbi:MAG: hypothetical protein KGS46_09815 [Chloroflexi bacterium]|nr:hypothetical protein [Chloroflexota bacterium]